MKNTARLTLLLVTLLSTCARAQLFTERYYDTGGNERATSVAVKNGRILLAIGSDAAPDRYRVQIMNTGPDGLPTDSWTPSTTQRTTGGRVVATSEGFLATLMLKETATTDNNLLSFFDDQGTPLGSTIAGAAGEDEQVHGAISTTDGGVLAFGNLGNDNLALIYRYSANGDLLWHRRYEQPGNRFTVFTSATQVGEDFALVGASTSALDGQTATTNVIRISANGTLMWARNFAIPGNRFETPRSIARYGTGELVFSAQVRTSQGQITTRMQHVESATGLETQARRLRSFGSFIVNDLEATEAGLVCIGAKGYSTLTGAYPMAFRYNPAPTTSTIPCYLYGPGGSNGAILDVVSRPDGFYFAGYIENCVSGNQDAMLVRVDAGLGFDGGSCSPQTILDNDASATIVPAIPSLPPGTLSVATESTSTGPGFIPVATGYYSFPCEYLTIVEDAFAGRYPIGDVCYDQPVPIVGPGGGFLNGSTDFFDSVSVTINLWNGTTPVPSSFDEEIIVAPEWSGWLHRRGAGYFVVLPPPGATRRDYDGVVRSLRYVNNQSPLVSGSRRITFGQFVCNRFDGTNSRQPYADLNLLEKLYAENDTVKVCAGETVTLNASQPVALNYRWEDGSVNPVRTITDPGRYMVEITGPCNAVQDTFTVVPDDGEQFTGPVISPVLLCFGDSVTVDLTTPDVIDYRWSDGDSSSVRRLGETGRFTVSLSNGCFADDVPVVVTVTNCCAVYRPNSFSPNFDGVNDVFLPLAGRTGCEALSAWSLRVFDRWGAELFSSTDSATGWNGRRNGEPLPAGVYAYVLEYSDGTTFRREEGDVTLLR